MHKIFFILFSILLFSCQDKPTQKLKKQLLPESSSIKDEKKEVPSLLSGDIIFQTSQSLQAQAIEIATKSHISHVGCVFIKDTDTLVLEAVQPVKLTPFKKFVARGKHKKYYIKRFKNRDSIIQTSSIELLMKQAKIHLGKNYDLLFDWSDKKMYCSELVYKIYRDALQIELGTLKKMKTFDLSHPIVQAKLKERYGKNIPLESTVISPQSIFEDERLELIPRE